MFIEFLYTISALLSLLASAVILKRFLTRPPKPPQGYIYPPVVSYKIPVIGHAISFGRDPLSFLMRCWIEYGDVFTIKMLGMDFTYLLGSDAATLFFNSKNEDLNAEAVYQKITTPVFGKGVAYDVPNKVFGEQKRMMKTGLTVARFRNYVSYIEQEADDFVTNNWSKNRNGTDINIFIAMSELTILTSSRCLHGKEIRALLDDEVAQLYLDLDGGFSHLAWLLPAWVPLPSFRIRDEAHKKMKCLFGRIINARRSHPDPTQDDDFLHVLINSRYKCGRSLTDDEIAGMLIAMLMAGQHTSSTTVSWVLLFLAQSPLIQNRIYQEQVDIRGDDFLPLMYEDISKMYLLENCITEALRMRAPLMTLMRLCKNPQYYKQFYIPIGNQVCVSPSMNHFNHEVYNTPETFNPDRYNEEKNNELLISNVEPSPIGQNEQLIDEVNRKSQEKFDYIPFGAGRHRCVGEPFAYLQIKTIVAYLIRHFRFELVNNKFPEINFKTMIHTPKDPIIRYIPRNL